MSDDAYMRRIHADMTFAHRRVLELAEPSIFTLLSPACPYGIALVTPVTAPEVGPGINDFHLALVVGEDSILTAAANLMDTAKEYMTAVECFGPLERRVAGCVAFQLVGDGRVDAWCMLGLIAPQFASGHIRRRAHPELGPDIIVEPSGLTRFDAVQFSRVAPYTVLEVAYKIYDSWSVVHNQEGDR